MWRRRDDRSAVSVTATVVRRGCVAGFSVASAVGILDLSFFPPISPPLYLASLYRGGLSNSQGQRRWRRFLATRSRA